MSKVEFKPVLRATLAANVRRLRESMEISQEALAAEVGFHRTYVSQVERGVSNVTLDNLELLANRLRVHPHELLVPHQGDRPAKANRK